MRTRFAVFAGSLVLLAGVSNLRAQDAKKAKIEEMFRLIKIDQLMPQVMSQVKAMAVQQIAEMNLPPEARAEAQATQTKMLDLITERLSWEKTKQAYIDLYSDVFNEEELEGMLAFYRSPAGRAMLEKMPTLMSKAMALSQKQVGDLQPEIQKLIQELKAREKK